MTIDEAIKHAEEVAEKQEKSAKEWHENQLRKCDLFPFADMDYTHENECKKCAEEHKQLAEWLKDYKKLLDQEPEKDAWKKGKWIKSDIGGAKVCSICLAHMGLSNFKYCPNCGAEMENIENDK